MIDETLPLLEEQRLSATADDRIEELTKHEFVDFNPDGDDENPLDWPITYKWGIVMLLALTHFTITFTCISVVPVASNIVSDLDKGQASKSASVLLVTIWELGEAAGPLFIAPLSEVFGRFPVINFANLLFIVATILGALSESAGVFIASRCLNGLAVAGNVLSPAIVGDLFISEQRGTSMSAIMLAPPIGSAVGAALSGLIVERMGWRSLLWASAFLMIVCEALFLVYFRETYKVPILRRRAARLRRETGDESLKTVFDVGGGSGLRKLWESVMRPVVVFSDSGVLQALSLFGALVFTYFYVISTSMPDILVDIYGLTPTEAGLCFISYTVGSAASVLVCNYALDRIYIRLRDANNGVGTPELRLPLVVAGGLTLPLVVALYGWTAEARLPLTLFLVVLALLGGTLILAFLPVMAYVVDAFGLYSASAVTALIVTRCLMGTFLPLATEPLVVRFGYGWGFTVLGAALLILIPIPSLIIQFGQRWRQYSKYTKDE